ncbi:LexA family protein [Paenibacillus koleovorans]|uniref:LexA family protein n=1 Tax=Paenibacillus koleovorans TaxID=121608 RepID=UPI000FDA9C1E|nr:XRE family transcriptional regulator [Paenibacillus koleovorans]
MSVGDRIKKQRKLLGMSVDTLAEKLNKNRATVYRYESDDIDNMPISILEPLAKALKVSPGYLMGWVDESEDLTSTTSYPYYPVSISAGLPSHVEHLHLEDVQKIEIPDCMMGKWASNDDIYITRINGDSMNKTIPHGSLIVVKQVELSNLKNGDIVVYSDRNEFSVKRFFNDSENERIIFRPDSQISSFADHVLPYREAGDIQIHGKVILYLVESD